MNLIFDEPPVVETVLTVQFRELEKFRIVDFGRYHETIKARFPDSADQPRLGEIVETFPPSPRFPKWSLNQGVEPQRVLYRSAAEGSLMLQLQPDRFALNWCKQSGSQYPRYSSYEPVFMREFSRFVEFAEHSAMGVVEPNLCEVVYINHLRLQKNESIAECCEVCLEGINWVSSDGWLPQPPEHISLNRTFPIEKNRGRLYVEVSSAKVGDADVVELKLTARTLCSKELPLNEAMALAHTWATKGFSSVTRESARRERWKQL